MKSALSESHNSVSKSNACRRVGPRVSSAGLRILLFCGLRPAELLAFRIEDVGANQLRIDEAVKEKEKGDKRIGETKTETSDAWVAVPPNLASSHACGRD